MGCCVSSNNSKLLPPTISNSSQQSEEETVKEVLSETPTFPISKLYTAENSPKKSSPISKFRNTMEEEKHHQNHITKKPIMANASFNHHPDDFSEEVSEICSSTLSEATVTAKQRYGAEDDASTEVRQRSPAKYRNGSYQRSVGNSPARRSDPSPGRVRSGSGRERKDNGECSGRRSRSPVMRTENGGYGSGLGRSPSVRKTGKSPGRVRSELGDRIRKMDYERDGNGENTWPPPPTNGNESLENPLVSLECFIFL